MSEILLNLLAQLTQEFRKRPRLRAWLVVLTPAIGTVFLILRVFVTSYGEYRNPINQLAETVLTPLVVLFFALFAVLALSYSNFDFRSSSRGTDEELDALRRERAELRAKLSAESEGKHDGPADVLDTIRLSLNQLTEYYTINKGQAKSSFRASMGAMVVGLLTILIGIWIVYSDPGGDVKVAVIAGVAGILAEFIAAAYFYLYNRSLTQLNYFYDKLTSMQDTMLAIKLCETLPESRSSAAKERLIDLLMTPGRVLSPQQPTLPKPNAPMVEPQSAETANEVSVPAR